MSRAPDSNFINNKGIFFTYMLNNMYFILLFKREKVYYALCYSPEGQKSQGAESIGHIIFTVKKH